ncbi:conserved membrane protein of unknown function [Georgfuchsia toluolica]|uniref:Polysaccharide biosynthesis protein n=1 Tax=Georgfuchsia toluolica TaxID=424218 RepID=A0A916NH35_9PROT|nr:oligosaccharide flippase family protein [Georgfuchsia toluolica]CAG4882894.1 conserved membrane protein of unknown function [Georgfuchsia toluolica]
MSTTNIGSAAALHNLLKRRALLIGAANAFDLAMHFLLPVVLVRFLAPEAFGQYRLLWLAIMTVAMLVPLNMPHVLNFFLPRADAATKRLHVHMTLLYLLCAGLLGSLAIGPWNPLLPSNMHSLTEYGALLPVLVVLSTVTLLLDMLPMIEERVNWQAGMTIALTLLRTLALGGAAWLTGDLRMVLWLLLALMLLKFLLLLVYVAKCHGLAGPWFKRPVFLDQFRHAVPLGLSAAIYSLRGQADQWIAASLFALGNFAAFSIAGVLGPMVTLFRLSISPIFLPSMSRLQSTGDLAGMVELNNKANVMVATLVYPLLVFSFVFAEEIITLIYTQAYVAAAPVMRIYAISLVVFVVELSSIMLLLREGVFSMRLNLALLLFSVAVSWIGAQQFGLAGAALGSTAALYADRFRTLRRIASTTGIPLRHLQDWQILGRLLLISALAGTLAWAITGGYFGVARISLRLIAGGMIMAIVYGALWMLSNWHAARWPLLAAITQNTISDKE